MWNKDKETDEPQSRQRNLPETESRRPPAGARESATIGPSITIEGEVSGDEDLLIQGRVNGSVDLKEQTVTVGSEGRVKADITGRVVTVEGEVEGDLTAEDRVVLRSSARVQGDITAPRVILEDGAQFQGLVDMGEDSGKTRGRGRGERAGAPERAKPERLEAGSSSPTATGMASEKKVDEPDETDSVKAGS